MHTYIYIAISTYLPGKLWRKRIQRKSHGAKKQPLFRFSSKINPNVFRCFLYSVHVCVWYSVALVCGSVYATAHGEQLYAIIYMITRNYLS